MKFRQEKNGFTVFAGIEEDGKLSRSLSDLEKLTFAIYLDNPSFMNFSDLPLEQQPGQVFYFNNTAVNNTEVFSTGSESLLLHKGDYVAKDELMKLEKEVYKFSFSGPGSEETARLVHTDTGLVIREKAEQKVDGNFEFEFVLSGLRPGRYHLEIDGSMEDIFYYTGDSSAGKLFGILEVFGSVPVTDKFFNASGDILFKEYTLAFNNRRTIWNYHVVSRNGTALVDPGIREASNPWNFSKMGDTLYRSDSVMPLREDPVKGIEFLADKNDSGSVIVHNLPNPRVDLVKPDPNDITKIYSDIYVYI